MAELLQIPCKYPDTAAGGVDIWVRWASRRDMTEPPAGEPAGGWAGGYQRPHGSRAVTATRANSRVR